MLTCNVQSAGSNELFIIIFLRIISHALFLNFTFPSYFSNTDCGSRIYFEHEKHSLLRFRAATRFSSLFRVSKIFVLNERFHSKKFREYEFPKTQVSRSKGSVILRLLRLYTSSYNRDIAYFFFLLTRSIVGGEEKCIGRHIGVFGIPGEKSRDTRSHSLEHHLMHRVEPAGSPSLFSRLSPSRFLPSENFARHGATSKRSFGFRRSRYGRL